MVAHLPQSTAQELDLDEARVQSAYDLLDEWTAEEALPGGAILVGRNGKTLAPHFSGRQGPEPNDGPIRDDGVFLLASISKPITYMGALILVERGLLCLNDRVTRYIPEFAAHHKDATRVHHLFTHTSGMPDMLANNVALRREHAPLSKFIDGAIRETVPLFAAGTSVSYQSMGTLVVAEIVQRISGLTIHEFLAREIFDPLELDSTGLGSRRIPRERIVRVETPRYQAEGDFGWNSTYWQQLGSPWGGMFSTPEDFAILCQLLLDGGAYGEQRILSPGTVEIATSNRLHDYPDLPEPLRRTQPWGLGWRMNHLGTGDSWSDLLDRSVFGHSGATGTTVWIDRNRNGFCILFTTGVHAKAPWRLVCLSNIIASAFR